MTDDKEIAPNSDAEMVILRELNMGQNPEAIANEYGFKLESVRKIKSSIQTLQPGDVIMPGAFGTGKKVMPLYWGEKDDPKRKLIGTCEVDLDTGLMKAEVTRPGREPMMLSASMEDRLTPDMLPPGPLKR